MKSQIIYSLNIDDIQTVANQEYGRDLSKDEIGKLVDEIGENIDWYNAILNAIIQKLDMKDTQNSHELQ
jgi:hypothetical protein